MKSPNALYLLFSVLTSCSTIDNLTANSPIIDTQGVSMARYEQDLIDCQSYADEAAVTQKAVIGAVTGAAVGGVFGAVVGNSRAAQRGAGVGTIGGGARGISAGLRERERVIKNCLTGRGYRVLN